jgi:hypothetical protein
MQGLRDYWENADLQRENELRLRAVAGVPLELLIDSGGILCESKGDLPLDGNNDLEALIHLYTINSSI